MKVNIVKELENSLSKRKQQVEESDVLGEIKGLLEYDAQRDMEILRTIGQRSSIVQSEDEKAKLLELEKKEKFLSGKVFTKEQIIKLGAKYRLKFLNSTYYTGYIDPLVVQEIKEMERAIVKGKIEQRAQRENMTVEAYMEKYPDAAQRMQIDRSELGNNFFILAPAKLFKTEKSNIFTKIPAEDPIMFYTDDNKHFRLIKKWGSDFTILRRIKGWLTKSIDRHIFTLYVLPLLVVVGLLCIKSTWWWLLGLIPIGISLIVFFANFKSDKEFGGENYVTSHKSFYM